MYIKIDLLNLNESLNFLSIFWDGKKKYQNIVHFKVDANTLNLYYDTEISSISDKLYCTSNEIGNFSIDGTILLNLTKGLNDSSAISLNVTDDRLEITSDNYSYSIPLIKENEKNKQYYGTGTLKTDLRKALDLISVLSYKRNTPVYFSSDSEGSYISITDGYRFTRVKFSQSSVLKYNVSIPKYQLDRIARSNMRYISSEESSIIFCNGGKLIISNILSNKFPDHNNLINRINDNYTLIDKNILLDAISRVGSLASDSFITLNITSERLTIGFSSEVGTLKENLICKSNFESIQFKLDYDSFKNSIENVSTSSLIIRSSDSYSPLFVEYGVSLKVTDILMPLISVN